MFRGDARSGFVAADARIRFGVSAAIHNLKARQYNQSVRHKFATWHRSKFRCFR
jgi:hypothetical protein